MFAARAGFFANQDTGPKIIFPASSIVPFYGSSIPTLADWTVYSSANGKYIAGTTNPTLLGTTTASRTASVNVGGVSSSAGGHTGSVPYVSGAATTTGGTLSDSVNATAGAHAHVGTSISFSDLKPDSTNVRMLIANKDTPTIPAGTLAFRRSQTGTYGTPLQPPGTAAYLLPGLVGGSISTGPGTSTWYGTTSSAGSHRHNNFNKKYRSTGTTSNYWGTTGDGVHTHTITASMYQSLMSNTMVLEAWTSLAERVPATDVVVMYVGNPSVLTGTGWYLCNGLNGTLNINDYYVAAGWNWGNTYSSDAYVSSVSLDSSDAMHSHISNYNGGSPGITIWHDTQSWYHGHTISSSSYLDFVGSKFYLYFIQYKG